MPLLMPNDFEQMNLVSWRVEQGQPDPNNPLLEPKMPWDEGGVFAHGTVLHDPIDGLWKAWHLSTPAEKNTSVYGGKNDCERRLTYLESEDGIHWRRPELPFVSWEGYPRTNILLGPDSGGTCTYANVLIDPERKDWPYEMFIMREAKYKNPSGTVGGLPLPKGTRGIYRYRSKDGKAWEVFEGPVEGLPSDIFFVYRQPDGSYVTYYKRGIASNKDTRIPPYDNNSNPPIIRVLARRTSPNGTDWGKREMVLVPDWRDPPDTQFMEICPLRVNGGFVAMVTVYHSNIQTMDLQVAASRDGVNWWVPDRRPALPNPPLGDYGGGMIWQMRTPIVEGNRMHVYYAGTEGIHGEIFDTRVTERVEARGETTAGRRTPSLAFASALCRATWSFDRLWALVPSVGGPTAGTAITKPRDCAGKRLWVNVRVRKRGNFQAQLLDKDGKTIPGYSYADCDTLTADHHRVQVKWKAGDRAPNTAVKVAFRLTRAYLYGFDWDEAADGFKPIFDGKTLTGWDGNPKHWKVENGMLVGETTAENPLKGNTYIIWRDGKVRDFELKMQYCICGGNSGIQFRSHPERASLGKWVVRGYQADIDSVVDRGWCGGLYDENGRKWLAYPGQKTVIGKNHRPRIVGQVAEPKQLYSYLKYQEWNDYHLIVTGYHFIVKINDHVFTETIDQDESMRQREGLLAFQLHHGPPMKLQLRNVRLKHSEYGIGMKKGVSDGKN